MVPPTPGTVTVGNITATGDANGGLVAIGGSSDVTVGNINTVGTTGTDGQVLLAVGNATISGTPVYTNGALSGGTFVPSALSAGDLVYGTINAGSGDVSLGGALTASDSIVGGVITADTLSYTIGAGTAVSAVGSNSNRLNVDATAAGGGSVTVNEGDNVIIDNVTGTNLNLTVNANAATGDIDIAGAIAVGTGTVNFSGNDVTQSTGTLAANNLGLSLSGNAALTTTISNLLDSTFANLTLTNTGNLTVNDFTATGFADIFNTGNLTVATGSVILGVDRLTFQTLGSTPGTITIGENANIQTAGATKSGNGEGDVLILQGVAPTKVRNLKGKNMVVTVNGTGSVLTGKGKGTKKITALNPNNAPNNLTGTNAMLLIKAQTKNGVVLGGGTTIVADPPPAAGTLTATTLATPRSHDVTVQTSEVTELNAPSALSSITTVPTLTSAPSINLNGLDNTISNLATANTTLGALGQMEDDSYMVTYAPMGQIVDGNVCSDMDFGFVSGGNAGSGSAVATMKHSDCVTLDNGSALFVPSRDMTVVTPKGSVKLAANSVAYVNANSNQLSVYDISDSHKASVVVSTGGRDLTLSPGRHLVVTHDKAKNFAEVNPIESIMHRSVKGHELGAGKRAFVSEFSIPSAVNVVKPLKAMLNSNDADAKKVAARIIKTSAVVMMVGGQAPFDFHTKPRTVALSWK